MRKEIWICACVDRPLGEGRGPGRRWLAATHHDFLVGDGQRCGWRRGDEQRVGREAALGFLPFCCRWSMRGGGCFSGTRDRWGWGWWWWGWWGAWRWSSSNNWGFIALLGNRRVISPRRSSGGMVVGVVVVVHQQWGQNGSRRSSRPTITCEAACHAKRPSAHLAFSAFHQHT